MSSQTLSSCCGETNDPELAAIPRSEHRDALVACRDL